MSPTFTNDNKERWETDLKVLLQQKAPVLALDRDVVAQIRSIRRQVLALNKMHFNTETIWKTGDASKFWAIALAWQ
jgi:hypothetical protein